MKKYIAIAIISFFSLFSGSVLAAGLPSDFVGPPAPMGGLSCEPGFEEMSGICIPSETGLVDDTVGGVLNNVLNAILAILAVLFLLGTVISGIQYLTAYGDEKQVDTAKRNLKYAITGLVIALSSFVILNTIAEWLSGDFSIWNAVGDMLGF